MISLNAGRLNLIGDALCSVPYLLYLAEKHQGVGLTEGFSNLVRALIPFADYNIQFDVKASDGIQPELLDLNRVFNYCNTINMSLHMCQGWFACAQEPIPSLPITLPLITTPSHMEGTYAVIAPFSRTDHQNNKLWPLDWWVRVADSLLNENLVERVVVVGSMNDEWGVLANTRCVQYIDHPLSEVLDLMRRSKLTMSIDNGISHLCHFGGVRQHLLLQPACLTQAFVTNLRGRYIQGNPLQIGVEAVTAMARKMLLTGSA